MQAPAFPPVSPPSPLPFAARIGSSRWLVTLASLTGITALSIDMSLPAQPTLARALSATPGAVQLTLSLFMLGYAMGQLLVGPLSDALGRRRVLLSGLLVFTVAGIGCALSPSIGSLLGFRLLQGIGAAAGAVIGRAMVRDTQPAASAARMLASMVAVLAIAPMIAPMIGGFLLTHGGWRGIFVSLAALGVGFSFLVGLTLEETLPKERRPSLSPRAVAAGFLRFFRTPGTFVPTLLVCASFAGQFAYVSTSPFVFIEGYGVSTEAYGLYFAATALALMGGALLNGQLLKRGLTPRHVLGIGAGVLCLAGLLVVVGAHASSLGVLGFLAPMMLYFLGIGLLGPNATALAMDPAKEIAGTASSAIGCLQMAAGAVSGWLATRFGGADPRALGFLLAGVGSLVASLVVVTALRGRRVPSAG